MIDSPYIIFWELTRACLLSCKHCRAEAIKERHPNELSTDECFKLINQLTEFKTRPIIVFTGGDPFMRDDMFEIVEYANDKGFRTAIAFSGTKKATKTKLRRLKNSGVSRVAISLDGSTPEKHDGFRGVRGTFKQSMQIMNFLKDLELPFQINTIVTKSNILDLPHVGKLCLEIGANAWDLFFLVPTGRARVEDVPSGQEFEDILNWLYDFNKISGLEVKSSAATHFRRINIMRNRGEMGSTSNLYYRLLQITKNTLTEFDTKNEVRRSGFEKRFGITDGRGMFFISHIGEVYPSGFLPVVAGNVRERKIKDIYDKSEIFVKLRDPNNLKGKCGHCEFRFICGGSRARAFAMKGDYLEAEPCCIYLPRQLSNDSSIRS